MLSRVSADSEMSILRSNIESEAHLYRVLPHLVSQTLTWPTFTHRLLWLESDR